MPALLGTVFFLNFFFWGGVRGGFTKGLSELATSTCTTGLLDSVDVTLWLPVWRTQPIASYRCTPVLLSGAPLNTPLTAYVISCDNGASLFADTSPLCRKFHLCESLRDLWLSRGMSPRHRKWLPVQVFFSFSRQIPSYCFQTGAAPAATLGDGQWS